MLRFLPFFPLYCPTFKQKTQPFFCIKYTLEYLSLFFLHKIALRIHSRFIPLESKFKVSCQRTKLWPSKFDIIRFENAEIFVHKSYTKVHFLWLALARYIRNLFKQLQEATSPTGHAFTLKLSTHSAEIVEETFKNTRTNEELSISRQVDDDYWDWDDEDSDFEDSEDQQIVTIKQAPCEEPPKKKCKLSK